MDWMENQICLRCNQGGQLLVCSENGCPIAVHKKCLGCPAHYDELGNFCCPYCMFKRVTEEMCQLRDKAKLAKEILINFINEEMTNSNTQKSKSQLAGKIEVASAALTQNESSTISEHSLENNAIQNQSAHLEEYHLQDPSPTATSIPLLCEGTEDLIVDKRNEEFLQKRSQSFGHTECNNSLAIVIYQPHLRPSIADDGGHERNEEITQQSENIDVGKIGEWPTVKEDTTLNGKILSTKRKRNHSQVLKETNSRTEEDNDQEGLQKSTVPVAPESPLQSEVNRGVGHGNSTCRDNDTLSARLRHVNQKKLLALEPQDVKSPRSSNQCSSSEEVNNREIHGNMTIDSNTSQLKRPCNARQLKQPSNHITNPPPLNVKRSRKRWTPEEEDMLKEGVEKYAQTVNQNFPWRKILEFGRHIFDESRTPVDLKDKWRNISGKRR